MSLLWHASTWVLTCWMASLARAVMATIVWISLSKLQSLDLAHKLPSPRCLDFVLEELNIVGKLSQYLHLLSLIVQLSPARCCDGH